MNGRQEADNKVEQYVLKKLRSCPEVLTEYYYSDLRKTPQTKRVYLSRICSFFEFLLDTYDIDWNKAEDFRRIKNFHINQFLVQSSTRVTSYGKEVKNSDSAQAGKFFAIANFMKFLFDQGYIDVDPCDKMSAPSVNVEKDIVALTTEEIKHIKQNIINGVGTDNEKKRRKKWVNRDLAIFELGISTGLRVGAIASINVEDIDFNEKSFIVVEKGNKTRTVYFGQNVEKALRRWLIDREKMLGGQQCDALFITQKKTRIDPVSINRMISLYSYDLGKRITPHKMRSTCATNLYEQTNDVYLVADVLGHKNLSNTRRYTKQSESRRRQAAEIMGDLFDDEQ